MTTPHEATLRTFEAALADADQDWYEFTLIVSGASDLSGRAIANARRLCDVDLAGRCQLSVVDLHEDPAAVLSSEVLAAPTLVKTRPLPLKKFVGDLSDISRVLRALGLPASGGPAEPTPD